MAKENAKKEEVKEVATVEQKNEVAEVQEDVIDLSLLESLEEMEEVTPDLSTKYLDLEIGQQIRGVFYGFGSFTVPANPEVGQPEKELKTVLILTKEGILEGAQFMLVSAFATAKKGQPYSITYVRNEKNGAKTTKIYTVKGLG